MEEILSHMAARVWTLQQDNAMSRNTLLVVGMPAGQRLQQSIPALMQPLTPHRILTFAEVRPPA